jgi:hypothetical protein
METTKVKTPFEEALEKGRLVSLNGVDVRYAIYALHIHKRDLSLWSKGIKINRFFKVTDYKKYYGIKGRNGVDVLKNFMIIYNQHVKSSK